jgi:hypothetical protein
MNAINKALKTIHTVDGQYDSRLMTILRYEIIKVKIIIIQLNSYLFACQLNNPRANYKVSTSERKETNIHKVQNKAK